MKKFQGKVVVITGAASGIGRALAIQFAAEGASLAIADLDTGGLEETAALTKADMAGIRCLTKRMDVSNAKEFAKFADEVAAEFGRVDILVNNAGVSHTGNFIHTSQEDLEWIFGINYWGVVNGIRSFLPLLLKQDEAVLVNLSSLFGLLGVRGQSAYCATKFAVRGLTESLRQELSGTPVSVICVHPGGIKTNIARNARMIDSSGKHSSARQEKMVALFDRVAKVSAEEAAAIIINGIRKNRPRVLIGKDAKIGSLIQRLFPATYEKVLTKII